MSRVSLLTAITGTGSRTEAEPVTIEIENDRAILVLDDGQVVSFDRTEIEAAVRPEETLRMAA